MKTIQALVACIVAAALAETPSAQTGNCVVTGIPPANTTFTYSYTQGPNTGTVTRRWEVFGDSGSRVHMTNSLQKSTTLSVTSSRAVNNLIVIDSTATEGSNAAGTFTASMTYSPGLVDGPALRVCEGQKWTVPPSVATIIVSPGGKLIDTIEGNGEVVSIKESITVPAGTFLTAHYRQTSTTKMGTVTSNTWRAIKEGIVVRLELAQPAANSVEVLTGMK